jgi:SynChlorMet cassette protein ScmC
VDLLLHNDLQDIVCLLRDEASDELDIAMMEFSLLPVYVKVLEAGGLPLHCAFMEWQGKAVLVPASGGTGKSTCCRRIPEPWRAVCDDMSLVVPNGRGYRVHPFPTWSDHLWKRADTTWDVQNHSPLSALFFLEQGAEDKISSLGRGWAAVRVTESAEQMCRSFYCNLDDVLQRKIKARIFENACRISRAVPAFRMSATLNGRFWLEMERMLRAEGVKE